MRRFVILAGALCGFIGSNAPCSAADALQPVWTVTKSVGAPSHVLYDPGTETILVSQISGEGDKKDGDGFVSRLDLKGQMQQFDWIAGLNAPKGLARSGKSLWVSDIDCLREFVLATGESKQRIEVPGAKFLTGVTADARGAVYVADMLTSTIHVYRDGKLSVYSTGDDLESPAGLIADQNRLIVAAWGLTADYTTKVPGRFLALEDRKPRPISKPIGNLYGIASDGADGWIGTDFATGGVLHVTEKSEPRELLKLAPGVGGVEYIPAARLLIVAELTENRISGYDLTDGLKRPKR